MNLAGGHTTVDLLTHNPAAVAAYTGSMVMLVLIVWLSVRTMHVAGAAR
jgi:heme A synthase